MKLNKELMAAHRFERKTLAELTVKEFRLLMQECFHADRFEVQRLKNEDWAFRQRVSMGAAT